METQMTEIFTLCSKAGLVDDNQPEKEFIMGGGSKNEYSHSSLSEKHEEKHQCMHQSPL